MTVTAYDLTGRTALVTGAASGIGRSTAALLASAGAVVHCADLDEEGARRTAERITSDGGSAQAHSLDVTDRAPVAAVVSAAAGSWRPRMPIWPGCWRSISRACCTAARRRPAP